MHNTLSLRGKIGSIFIAMIVIVLVAEGGMSWYAYRMDTMLGTVVEKEFLLYRTAQEMELVLANQKGLLTYYLVDGDGKWLKSLGQQRELFLRYLEQAKAMDLNRRQQEMIALIGKKFDEYAAAKDVAIENYQGSGKFASISSLHEKQREIFFSLLEQCRTFSEEQWRLIDETQHAGSILTKKMRMAQLGAVAIFTTVFMVINYILKSDSLILIPWITVALLCIFSFMFSIPRRYYNMNTMKALASLPKGMILMLGSLLKIRGANKQFIHTKHGATKTTSKI